MAAYYNEIDEFAAAWLRELIKAGHIAPGDVDTRSIEDVKPDDLKPYTQCHFFAGIGVWSYALRLVGWPDERPIWTGSCPCQPFSAAGKGGGTADERHLWPAQFHLIRERRPDVWLGEQVASKDGLGWLDIVRDDLEGEGYAVGAIDTSSALTGAPHIRQRLRIGAKRLADTGTERRERRADPCRPAGENSTERVEGASDPQRCGDDSGLADAGRLSGQPLGFDVGRAQGEGGGGAREQRFRPDSGAGGLFDGLGDAQSVGREGREPVSRSPARNLHAGAGADGGLGDTFGSRLEGLGGDGDRGRQPGRDGAQQSGPAAQAGKHGGMANADSESLERGRHELSETEGQGSGRSDNGHWPGGTAGRLADAERRQLPDTGRGQIGRDGPADAGALGERRRPGQIDGFWRAADWLFCRDERWRPVEPGTFPLAHGAPARVGRLRGFGNAVDAVATANFIAAFEEAAWPERFIDAEHA